MRIGLTSCIFLVLNLCFGQQDLPQKSWRIQTMVGSGYLIAHRPTMKHLPSEVTFPIEISISSELRGTSLLTHKKRDWHKSYGMPEVSLGIVMSGSGNKAILGTAFGFLGALRLPVINKTKYRLNFSLGAGLGWLTKKFDLEQNLKNVAIGSNTNVLLKFGLYNQFNLDPFHFYVGAHYMHFSNASFATPNLGLNLPGLELGIAYELAHKQTSQTYPKRQFMPNEVNLLKLDLIAKFGAKENYPVEREKFPIFGLELLARKPLGKRSSLLGAFDLMYNSARLDLFEQEGFKYDNWQATQIGLTLGYGQNFNRCMLFIQTGLYLYDYKSLQTIVYSRYGALIDLNRHLRLSIAVKSHFAKADYLEIGLGFKLVNSSKK